MKRRSLVLTDKRAHHRFLARLARSIGRRKARLTAQDLREFLLAYFACFLAVSLYIA